MKVFIWGFMGSGKTTLYRHWLREWNGHHFDFDEVVLERLGLKPQDLSSYIDEKGWGSFRDCEREVFKETLQGTERGLYSLGGGTLASEESWGLIDQFEEAKVLWLDTQVEDCWSRVKSDLSRPLVRAGEEAFYELYHSRLPFYKKCHLKVASDSVLEDCLHKLRSL